MDLSQSYVPSVLLPTPQPKNIVGNRRHYINAILTPVIIDWWSELIEQCIAAIP